LIGNPVLGENANTQRYQGKSPTENKKQGPARGVTLKSEKQVDDMAEQPKYYVEIFVQDFHGKRTSLGKTDIEFTKQLQSDLP